MTVISVLNSFQYDLQLGVDIFGASFDEDMLLAFPVCAGGVFSSGDLVVLLVM